MNQTSFQSAASNTHLSARELQAVWRAAAQVDNSLNAPQALLPKLAENRIEPISFSRAWLFNRMARCEPVLFGNFPIRPRRCQDQFPVSSLLAELRSGFPASARARVRKQNSTEFLAIPLVLDRWMRGKSVFGVTDLHYIGTRFDARMDTLALNDFNLLPRGTDGFQSQDSLVISSAGAFTDSHSDDHSGSNHSFVGTKLWLLWDTLEGFKHGLEDAEHCPVYDRAAFDLSSFLALPSSRWILIGPGQTMFIPAHLTHKVVTLEPYLGLGSFHAGLPGFVDLLKRWNQLYPLWASRSRRQNRCSVDYVTQRAIRRIQSLRKADQRERRHWGVPYLQWRLRQPDVNDTDLYAPMFGEKLRDFIRTATRL
jgi:hypothetical protein